ncbi:unnamed protein product [Meganyctiphanes norvegica]|uniref:Uncharacterized protein n=1 Tax=Meganyctiphanes norvegica TaxID=48144 RepID=A0AAV2R783_MEGNR
MPKVYAHHAAGVPSLSHQEMEREAMLQFERQEREALDQHMLKQQIMAQEEQERRRFLEDEHILEGRRRNQERRLQNERRLLAREKRLISLENQRLLDERDMPVAGITAKKKFTYRTIDTQPAPRTPTGEMPEKEYTFIH